MKTSVLVLAIVTLYIGVNVASSQEMFQPVSSLRGNGIFAFPQQHDKAPYIPEQKTYEQKTYEVSPELECTIISDKGEYLLGETVIIKGFIKNNTEKEITVSTLPQMETTFFTHYRNDTQSTKVDGVTFSEPNGNADFVTIPPNSIRYTSSAMYGEDYFNEIGHWEIFSIDVFDFTGSNFGLEAWTGEVKTQ